MAAYTLAQAAAAVGRNRSSILRAIKAGKISAVRDDATSEWRIEPADLHRVYPAADALGDAQGNAQSRNDGAQIEIRELRSRLADAQDQITDLRRRLDAEAEERRRLTAVLADRSTPSAVPVRHWWPWRRS